MDNHSRQELATQAIQAATQGNWTLAITLNQQIVNLNPHDTATLNRLGRAYTATGNLDQAKLTYQKVLQHDPQNIIAQKNLDKLNLLQHTQTASPVSEQTTVANQALFIKKPGVSKLVNLVHLGAPEVIASLSCGDLVELNFSKRTIAVYDHLHRQIGRLPDDMAFRFNQLAKIGYLFSACIKETHATKIQIMIQETSRTAN